MTKSYKTTLSLSVIAAIVVMVVAVAPLATSVDARKVTTTTCSSGPTAGTGECPGNSGSGNNPNRCETTITKAGQGGGSGSIKDESSTC